MSGAAEYAKALFLLSEEEKNTDITVKDAASVLAVLKENPDYHNLADTPALPTNEKTGLIDSAFSSVNRNLLSLMKILCENREFYSLPKILSDYLSLVDESRGILNVTAVTAVPMTENQKTAMKEKLSAMTGKTIRLENRTDPKVLGGVRLRYAGVQLDSTLETRLNALEKSLKAAIVS